MSIVEMEELVYNAFERRSDHFFEQNEKPESLQESLALMQHNGIPTRLVDWTKGPYIATYFAIRDNSGRNAAVWAINLEDCLVNSKLQMMETIERGKLSKNNDDFYGRYGANLLGLLKEDIEIQKNYLAYDNDQREKIKYNITIDSITKFIFKHYELIKEKSKGIVSVYPEKLNKRMLTQQAIFLCPVDITTSFLENINGMYRRVEWYGLKTSPIVKIVIPENIFRDTAKELDRFNINGYSLFPDKSGLSDWFTETFIPNKASSSYPFRPSLPVLNLTEKINRFVQSVIHMDIRVPNQPGSTANILNVF